MIAWSQSLWWEMTLTRLVLDPPPRISAMAAFQAALCPFSGHGDAVTLPALGQHL